MLPFSACDDDVRLCPRKLSGVEQRRRVNSLPKPVYIYSSVYKNYVAVSLIVACIKDDRDERFAVRLSNTVVFCSPIAHSITMCKSVADVFMMAHAADMALRTHSVHQGGTAVAHFSPWSAVRRKILSLTQVDIALVTTSARDPGNEGIVSQFLQFYWSHRRILNLELDKYFKCACAVA